MDILKRAYLKIKKETATNPPNQYLDEFHSLVRDEVYRLIKVGAYGGQDWPRQFGPLPDELRSKKAKRKKN